VVHKTKRSMTWKPARWQWERAGNERKVKLDKRRALEAK
jgi:hypothetical protein